LEVGAWATIEAESRRPATIGDSFRQRGGPQRACLEKPLKRLIESCIVSALIFGFSTASFATSMAFVGSSAPFSYVDYTTAAPATFHALPSGLSTAFDLNPLGSRKVWTPPTGSSLRRANNRGTGFGRTPFNMGMNEFYIYLKRSEPVSGQALVGSSISVYADKSAGGLLNGNPVVPFDSTGPDFYCVSGSAGPICGDPGDTNEVAYAVRPKRAPLQANNAPTAIDNQPGERQAGIDLQFAAVTPNAATSELGYLLLLGSGLFLLAFLVFRKPKPEMILHS